MNFFLVLFRIAAVHRVSSTCYCWPKKWRPQHLCAFCSQTAEKKFAKICKTQQLFLTVISCWISCGLCKNVVKCLKFEEQCLLIESKQESVSFPNEFGWLGWGENCFVFTMSFIVREKSLATQQGWWDGRKKFEWKLSTDFHFIASLSSSFPAAVVLIRLTAAAGEAGSETLSSQFHRARA